jgi:hypothetical protein
MITENINVVDLTLSEMKGIDGGKTFLDYAAEVAGAILKAAINGEIYRSNQVALMANQL